MARPATPALVPEPQARSSPLVAKVTGQTEAIEMAPAPYGAEELVVTIAAGNDVSPKTLKKQLKPIEHFIFIMAFRISVPHILSGA